jgi:hypothetical protein
MDEYVLDFYKNIFFLCKIIEGPKAQDVKSLNTLNGRISFENGTVTLPKILQKIQPGDFNLKYLKSKYPECFI